MLCVDIGVICTDEDQNVSVKPKLWKKQAHS